MVKLTSGEVWIAVAIAVCAVMVLVLLWLMAEPVLHLDVL